MVPVRGRLHYADAEDLLHEALVKTLDGTRRWRHGVTFMQHMVGCMSSIANNWFEQAGRNTELSDTQASSPALDSVIDSLAAVNRLRDHLESVVALDVLDTLLEGYTPAEAQGVFGIPQGVYWAARKQIRRQAEVLVEREGKTDGR